MKRLASAAWLILFACASASAKDKGAQQSDSTTVVAVLPTDKVPKHDSLAVGDVHPQDSPANRGFLIVTSDGKSQLRIRGSVRLNGAYDLGGVSNVNAFNTVDIPVGDEASAEARFFMAANQTRLGIDAQRDAGKFGTAFVRVEGDFLGDPNNFRLRHAYGNVRHVLVGQTWSTFSDVEALPTTVDLGGPNSSVDQRTVQIRYTNRLESGLEWSAAVESPRPDISVPDSLQLESVFQSFPDFIGRLGHSGDWGHMQVAGVLRSITVRDASNELNVLAGYGGLFSGSLVLSSKNQLYYQAAVGAAIARFVSATTNKGMDVIFNPETMDFETTDLASGFLSFGREWDSNFKSFLTGGLIRVFNKTYEPDSAFKWSGNLSANVFWEPVTGTRWGAEASWGQRENKDGQTGTAARFSFIFYYDF